jgi:hypothetical protein
MPSVPGLNSGRQRHGTAANSTRIPFGGRGVNLTSVPCNPVNTNGWNFEYNQPSTFRYFARPIRLVSEDVIIAIGRVPARLLQYLLIARHVYQP